MKLLLGGSPCTHWSIAQTRNRETQPEGLGWELFRNYLIAKERFRPDFYLYENNKSMAPAIRAQITAELGVEPILINSALVSAQNRQRLYWTNIPAVEQPEDMGILLRDILETSSPLREQWGSLLSTSGGATARSDSTAPLEVLNVNPSGRGMNGAVIHTNGKSRTLTTNKGEGPKIIEPVNTCVSEQIRIKRLGGFYGQCTRWGIYDVAGKAPTLTASAGMGGGHVPMYPVRIDIMENSGEIKTQSGSRIYPIYEVKDNHIIMKGKQYPVRLADGFYMIRKLTVTECKRLQTVPDKYIFPVSDCQAYKMLGNGWTVDVIAHILSYCPGITTEPLEVLSMYDGMSCGHLALDELGANIIRYYATEIDKYAIQTTQTNFPDTIQLGDAFQVREDEWWSFLSLNSPRCS